MMIDLKNTYIQNDFGELRNAYVKAAAAQGYQIDDGTEPVEWLDGDLIFINPHHGWCLTTGGSHGMIKPINKMKKVTLSDITGIAEKGNTEWNGEGLPPVGVECELSNCGNSWKKAHILYMGTGLCVVNHGYGDQHYHLNSVKFRPIETSEQKAARERLEAAYHLYGIWCDKNDYAKFSFERFSDTELDKEAFFALVDETGYRKTE